MISNLELDRARGCFVLVAVAAPTREGTPARDEIRAQLRNAGFEERGDFICVA